jgi:seryl-tRNA synthetase
VYLLGDIVRLDQALINFSIAHMVRRGFTPVFPPFLMRRAAYEGVVDLGDFETVMYKVEGEDLYLIATSEHPIGAMYLDEVIDEDDLPLRFCGLSTNFRREIGGHGVDTKGLFRMHQFNKVEQFVFCRPGESPTWHERLRENGEAIYRALEIPYRVVNVCTGDIGTVAAKKYDIEAWFPRQGAYREVISCSNCTEYQARRLNVRAGKVGGEKFVPHTLNSTAMATSRGLVAILENYQDEDGSVTIPKALRPYMDGQEAIRPPNRA